MASPDGPALLGPEKYPGADRRAEEALYEAKAAGRNRTCHASAVGDGPGRDKVAA